MISWFLTKGLLFFVYTHIIYIDYFAYCIIVIILPNIIVISQFLYARGTIRVDSLSRHSVSMPMEHCHVHLKVHL